jgi:type I restriction enzyme S subunit
MKLETFFEKFDQFADAPNAVGKMRELVFQLAVQGRLVQQDRTEESATVLLKRIRAARAELPTNRRSIDETDTTELEEESKPFAVPSGWEWTSLGNVQVFTNGYAFKSEDYQSSGVGIIRMGELGANGEIDERNMKYVTNDIAQSLPETFRVRPGDLLMGMSGSIGKLAINRSDKTYLLNQRVGRLEPILIEKAFLHVFLKTVERHYLRISFGMAIKNLSTKQINETPFPLPPLAEQKRIVAKVDELMALCDRLEAQQLEREAQAGQLARASLARFADAPTPANLNLLFHSSFPISPSDLRKSILTLAVQGKLVPQDPNDEPAEELLARLERELTPERCRKQASPLASLPADSLQYDLPDSWTWARFCDAAIIASNLVKPDDFLDFTHLAPDNIEKGNGVLLTCRTVREDKVISSNHRFYPGQIVYSKIRPNLAKVVVVDFEGLCSADMYPIDALINVFYLQLYMLSESFLVQAVKTDTRVAMPKINQSELNAIAVPIPPLAEQRRIVAKVSELMALVDELETQLAASRAAAEKLLSALVAELTGTTSRLPADS